MFQNYFLQGILIIVKKKHLYINNYSVILVFDTEYVEICKVQNFSD